MPRVLNARDVGFYAPNAVYVGRPSDFGNPFSEKDYGRTKAIEKFKELVLRNPEYINQIKRELRGKDLICWCSPKACHADILLEIANE